MSRWPPTPRHGLLVLLVASGLASNLASNFVGPVELQDCVDGTVVIVQDGDHQVGNATAPLGRSLSLKLTCRLSPNAEPTAVRYQSVSWRVASGGGQVNGFTSAMSFTDSPDGRAEVLWQLGASIGQQTVTAEALGRSFTFTAQAGGAASGGTCAGGAGTTFEAERRIVGDERWPLAGSPYRGQRVRVGRSATLTLEAGATACLEELLIEDAGRVQAAGQPGQPVTLLPRAGPRAESLRLEFSALQNGTSPSVMRHVVATGLAPFVNRGHTLVLEDSQLTMPAAVRARLGCARFEWLVDFASAGSVRRVVLDGYGGGTPACDAGVLLTAQSVPSSGLMPFEARVRGAVGDAVRVIGPAGDVFMLSNCEVSGASGHGVVLDGTGNRAGARVGGCNLTGNAGFAVLNLGRGGAAADARDNWWGSAAGPATSGPNAVSAGVEASRPASAPLVLGY